MVDINADMERRLGKIEDRVQWLDEHGTRAISAVSMQLAEVIKDIGELKGTKFANIFIYLASILPLYALVIALLVK